MELKIFGKNIFEITKGKGNVIANVAQQGNKKSIQLPDFYRPGGGNTDFISISEYVETGNIKKVNVDKEKEEVNSITPKEAYSLKLLNNESFEIKVDPAYVDQQLADFKDKLSLLDSQNYDMARGIKEIGSILVRFENRKKYFDHKEFYEQFPYTTTSKVEEMLVKHKNLKVGQLGQFIADIPKEALNIIKDYDKETQKMCDQKAVYYIIADKKDFKQTASRKDPILLAQSPFGHFWQILGAWDEEMLFIEEL